MHISFDFDYTLADSTGGTVVCANYALMQMGMTPFDAEIIAPTIGLTLEKTFLALTGNTSATDAAAFEQHFHEHADRAMLDHIELYDATGKVLSSLKRSGHYVSIVSTKERLRIEAAMARDSLLEYVDHIVGGSCVTRNKPDPEGLLLAIDIAGIPKQETIFVGDSISDAECASRADVTFFAVLSGKTSAETLGQWKPQQLLAEVGELLSLEGF